MPHQSPYHIVLPYEEKEDLERITRKYASLYYEIVRAKAILYAAEGLENKEIGQRLAGLEDRPGRGQPRAFSSSGGRGGQSLGM